MKKPPQPRLPKDAADNYVFLELHLAANLACALEDKASARKVTVQHLMWEYLAADYQEHGEPLPPEIRSYLTENAEHIPSKLRAKLLKPDLH